MKQILKNRIFQLSIVLIGGILVGALIFRSGRGTHVHALHPDEEPGVPATWTCSMHPQIRQDTPGKCPICGMDLVPVDDGQRRSGQTSPFVYQMTPEAVALANIRTSKVQSLIPEHSVDLVGKVAVNEQRLEVLTADYSGRIEQLYIDFTGQRVRKGDKIASLYSPELIVAQRELLEAAKFRDINNALYDAVVQKLRLWNITDEQIDEMLTRGTIVNTIDIFAGVSGVVLRRLVARGDYVSKGSVLFEIGDLSNVWVLLEVYEADLPWIRLGQRVSFSTPAFPGRQFNSTITFISPVIDPRTRTVAIRAEAANTSMQLKPDMYVQASIRAGLTSGAKALVVPKSAILWTGQRSIVYVQEGSREDPAFALREIELGVPVGDHYTVNEGLHEGEEIVTHGVFMVDAAAQLSGNYSMMHRPVDRRMTVPETLKTQFDALVIAYFDLKNALVGSNFDESKIVIAKLSNAFRAIDISHLDAQAEKAWAQIHNRLNNVIDELTRADDLEMQRNHFSDLSDAIIEMAQTFDLSTGPLFVDYCPMAFDNQGAYWLSEIEEIRNPYFGSAMLTCGIVKERIGISEQPVRQQQQLHQH